MLRAFRHLGTEVHRTIMIAVLAALLMPSLLLTQAPMTASARQSDTHLTVADWTFDLSAAAMAPTFSDVIHLGVLDDGRSWLVVALKATNTSGKEQKIHSDKIQLLSGSEHIKQTGDESEIAARELGFQSIGGSSPHKVKAGVSLDVLQVFKVAPSATGLELEFDFTGKWRMPLDALLKASNGSGIGLATKSTSRPATPADQRPWTIRVAQLEFSIIGATSGKTFTGPFHLGMLDDGRDWLVITYGVKNLTDKKIKIDSDDIQLLSGGKQIKQAGDETRSVAKELGIDAPSKDLDKNKDAKFVQVYKITPGEADNTLRLDYSGLWFVNLAPLTKASNSNPETVDPSKVSAPSVAMAPLPTEAPKPGNTGAGSSSNAAQTAMKPTSAPTPTPTPSPIPTQTPVPALGSANRPASIGDTVEVDGRAITLLDATVTSSVGGFYTPKGGYEFVVITVKIRNVSTSGKKHDYNELYFSGKDIDRGWDFDDTGINLSDSPLGSGELSPGEYVTGQVVLEVHQETTSLRIKYDTSPIGGKNAYWLVRLQ